MTKAKTDLTTLTDKQLFNRICSAFRRAGELEAEQARRDELELTQSGGELREYTAEVTVDFSTTVYATTIDEAEEIIRNSLSIDGSSRYGVDVTDVTVCLTNDDEDAAAEAVLSEQIQRAVAQGRGETVQ